jgi:hypothetical protein
MGILHSGIRSETDVAFALLEDQVDNQSAVLKISAMNGIAIAYAGSCREDISARLLPHIADETNTSKRDVGLGSDAGMQDTHGKQRPRFDVLLGRVCVLVNVVDTCFRVPQQRHSDRGSGRHTHNTDSARHNLASTFVNAFVNAGFGNEKLVVNVANCRPQRR